MPRRKFAEEGRRGQSCQPGHFYEAILWLTLVRETCNAPEEVGAKISSKSPEILSSFWGVIPRVTPGACPRWARVAPRTCHLPASSPLRWLPKPTRRRPGSLRREAPGEGRHARVGTAGGRHGADPEAAPAMCQPRSEGSASSCLPALLQTCSRSGSPCGPTSLPPAGTPRRSAAAFKIPAPT